MQKGIPCCLVAQVNSYGVVLDDLQTTQNCSTEKVKKVTVSVTANNKAFHTTEDKEVWPKCTWQNKRVTEKHFLQLCHSNVATHRDHPTGLSGGTTGLKARRGE